MKTLVAAAVLVLVFVANGASSAVSFFTGSTLLNLCATPKDNKNYVPSVEACKSYIAGSVDTLTADRKVCPPNTSIDQITYRVGIHLAGLSKKELSANASELIFDALKNSHKCL